jgi:hypothetical protein
MPRIWLSGPRLFGLVRPGISFALSELTKPSRRAVVRFDPKVIVRRKPERISEPGQVPGVSACVELEALEPTAELEPPPRPAEYPLHTRIAAWVIWGFAIWGLISMVGCMFSGAHAGTCRYYSYGPDAVTACEDGSVIVRHQDGRVDRYGTPNAGFERYPGQKGRPVFERREGE